MGDSIAAAHGTGNAVAPRSASPRMSRPGLCLLHALHQNGGVLLLRLASNVPRPSVRRSVRRPVPLLLLVASLVLVGCEAGVNQRLLDTPTAYPVRSPVVPSAVGSASGAGSPLRATAEAALRAGRLATAEAAFDAVLAATPTEVDALAGRAAARAAGGDLEGAGADLDAALDGRDDDVPLVLLAHQPVMVEQARAAGVDLQLSGHTHGGQLWPFDYAILLDQPVVEGWSQQGPTQLYVTAGAGNWGPQMRVGARPEVTVVELQPGEPTPPQR